MVGGVGMQPNTTTVFELVEMIGFIKQFRIFAFHDIYYLKTIFSLYNKMNWFYQKLR